MSKLDKWTHLRQLYRTAQHVARKLRTQGEHEKARRFERVAEAIHESTEPRMVAL